MKKSIPYIVPISLLILLMVGFSFYNGPISTKWMYLFVVLIVVSYFSLLHLISNHADKYDDRAIIAPVLLFSITTFLLILLFGYVWMVFGNFAAISGTKLLSGIDAFYFSGITFFTIGYGDFVPSTDAGKLLALVEALLGATHMVAFLAIVLKNGIKHHSSP